MGIIPAGAHRALDFVTVVAFAVAPTLFGMTGRTVMLAYALAAVHLILTLATHVPGREPRPVPYHVHGLIELLVGAALVALPLLRGWTGGARTFYLGVGVVILHVWLLTSYRDVVSAPRPPAARTPAV